MTKITPYFKNCPKCNTLIYYSRKDNLKSSIDKKSLCKSCSKKGIKLSFKYDNEWKQKVSKGWFKKGERPKNADFRKDKSYEEIYGIEKANEIKVKFSKRTYSEETNKKRSISCFKAGCGKSNKGRKLTIEHKKLLSTLNKGRKLTIEHRRALRKARIESIKKTTKNFHPSYNKKACEYFDKLMEEKNIHIQHALNGGEFFIKELYYWVDGYDKKNNTVYEFDKKQHFDSDCNLKEKDIIRQKEITDYLNCDFIRIRYDEI
jgi:hypothetical protein